MENNIRQSQKNSFYPKYMKYKSKYLSLKREKTNAMTGGATNLNEIILFKAKWCGYCDNFKPIWEDLDKTNKEAVKFITVDESDKKLVDDYKEKGIIVGGYPSVYINKNDEYYEYAGEMNKEGILKFIKNF